LGEPLKRIIKKCNDEIISHPNLQLYSAISTHPKAMSTNYCIFEQQPCFTCYGVLASKCSNKKMKELAADVKATAHC